MRRDTQRILARAREQLKLVWKYGEEAICPACQHNNACLYSGGRAVDGVGTTYTCRDCRRTWRTTGPTTIVGKDSVLGRNIGEAPCEEVTP